MSDQGQDLLSFWNERAGLGEWAGTRDVLAKQIEVEAIAEFIQDGQRILEVGCGNGITAIEMARRHRIDLLGVDFAKEMIAAANQLLEGQQLKGRLRFEVGDVREMSGYGEGYDLIYTERVLINLPDWPSQHQAIRDITRLLRPGGLYVMLENSQDGVDQLNEMRARVELPPIAPPWHNRYLRDAELETVSIEGVRLEGQRFYSSTYYFLSRVANAWLAAQEGREPEYEAPLNQLALKLPPIGQMGQGRIWLWRKAA